MTLLVLTFLAGILTILAPCVLPILPIILAGSLGDKSWKRPLLITVSLALSVVAFTVLLKATTLLINIPAHFWSYFSGTILITLWLIYLFPHTWAKISTKFWAWKSQVILQKTQDIHSGNLQSIATGFALGPVFSSCSPTYAFLLATIFPSSLLLWILYTFSYAFGLSLILFIIAWGWQSIIKKLKFFADEKGLFRRSLGLIFIAFGIAIATGFDKKIEIYILSNYNIGTIEAPLFEKFNPKIQKLEKKEVQVILPSKKIDIPIVNNTPEPQKSLPQKNQAIPQKMGIKKIEAQGNIKSTSDTQVPLASVNNTQLMDKNTDLSTTVLNEANPYTAPEISLTDWINSKPLTMASLKGKVVLIDFWTFECINCQNTLPHITKWYNKYKDAGFVVIGVHAPEFATERIKENVVEAVKKANIFYPVVLDNDYALWKAYDNQYWPAEYFIDKKGKVRHTHFGEGKYDESEKVILKLLAE